MTDHSDQPCPGACPSQPLHAPAHARLIKPTASAGERRAAQQARVGILRNPAEPKLPTLPQRDVWRKWPRLRSTRRQRCETDGKDTARDQAGQTGARGPVPSAPGAEPLPDTRALDAFARVLRQSPRTSEPQ